jgi:hypothetical protein
MTQSRRAGTKACFPGTLAWIIDKQTRAEQILGIGPKIALYNNLPACRRRAVDRGHILSAPEPAIQRSR